MNQRQRNQEQTNTTTMRLGDKSTYESIRAATVCKARACSARASSCCCMRSVNSVMTDIRPLCSSSFACTHTAYQTQKHTQGNKTLSETVREIGVACLRLFKHFATQASFELVNDLKLYTNKQTNKYRRHVQLITTATEKEKRRQAPFRWRRGSLPPRGVCGLPSF